MKFLKYIKIIFKIIYQINLNNLEMEKKAEKQASDEKQIEYEKIQTNKGQDAYIIENKFYFRFERLNKDNIKLFRCNEYRKTSKCPAYFKLSDEKIIEKDFNHNHNDDEKDCSKYII